MLRARRCPALVVAMVLVGCAPGPGPQDGGSGEERDAGVDGGVAPGNDGGNANDAGRPTVLRVMGNVDAGGITSFTRVSFVLENGQYTYFRIGEANTFVSAVTSKYAVGRFENQSGDVDSFVLDLATNQNQVFRLPDLTEVWLVDANERGTAIGTAKRAGPALPDGGETFTTVSFRHNLNTGRTTELQLTGDTFYVDLLEDDTALAISTQADGGSAYLIERGDGGLTRLRLQGPELAYQYFGLMPGNRIIGIRSSETRGAVISTIADDGLTHRFLDVPDPDGGLYPTTVVDSDVDGLGIVRYDVPLSAGGTESRYFLQGLGPSMAPRTELPPAAPIFLDPALAAVTYDGVRWGRVWGVATYFGP